MQLKLDNLVLNYIIVSIPVFEKFIKELQQLEDLGFVHEITWRIGKAKEEYRYNYHVGSGEGAIFIGHQHNSETPSERDVRNSELGYRMKVEYNPQKMDKSAIQVINALQSCFVGYDCMITAMDFAIDLPVNLNNIFVFPKTGRVKGTYKDTRYYGSRGKHGYLKTYNKKNERKAKIGKKYNHDGEITRIEFTWKGEQYHDRLKPSEIDVNDLYEVYYIPNTKDITALYRALIFALQHNEIQLNDLTRTQKKNLQKALESQKKIDFNSYIKANWKDIDSLLYKLLIDYHNTQLSTIGHNSAL